MRVPRQMSIISHSESPTLFLTFYKNFEHSDHIKLIEIKKKKRKWIKEGLQPLMVNIQEKFWFRGVTEWGFCSVPTDVR